MSFPDPKKNLKFDKFLDSIKCSFVYTYSELTGCSGPLDHWGLIPKTQTDAHCMPCVIFLMEIPKKKY